MVFVRLTLLPNPQNPMLYNAFQSAWHPKSDPSHGGIYTPRNTCSLHPPDLASQTVPQLAHPFLHSSWQRFPILYTITTVLRPFFLENPGEPVPEAYFWTLWCKWGVTEADTPTIQLGATPSGLTTAHLHHPPIFYRLEPAAQPTVSIHTSMRWMHD